MYDALISIDIFSVVVLLILLAFCILEKRDEKLRYNYFALMIIAEIFYLGFNALQLNTERQIVNMNGSLEYESLFIAMRGLSNTSFFIVLAMFTLFLDSVFKDNRKTAKVLKQSLIVVCLVYAAGCLASAFVPVISHIFFYVDEFGSHYKPTFVFAQIGAYYLVAAVVVMLVKNKKKLEKLDVLAIMSFIICPMIVSILRFFGVDIVIMPQATAVSFIVMFCFLYLKKSEKIRSQDLQIANNRLAVLQNQIRPHFLYNTLNSIYYLCGKDPKAAQQAIGDFAEYMRANLESLEEDETIPLERELDHVDHYLSLERMRFGGDLEIEYDTDYTDMVIPPMTLQIIAENAVKHGIEKKTDGFGKIVIRTRRTVNSDLIVVEDNGVGFNVEDYNSDPGSHVGLVNVKERLRQLLDASLIIESEKGRGTSVSILIPRNKKKGKE